MKEFQRARSAEQKDIRMNEITDAAIKLLRNTPFDRITLAAVAQELSFTRANLYKYVSTKEEIFLHIVQRDVAAWVADLETTFEGSGALSIEAFAQQWAACLSRHRRLVEMLSVLYSVIEKNVTAEKLAEFKAGFFDIIAQISDILRRVLPFLSEAQIQSFLQMQMYYATGLFPSTVQTDVQKEAMALIGAAYDVADFEYELTAFAVFALEGLQNHKEYLQ